MQIQTLPNYHPQAGLLRDRVILVTGAGAGIGRVAAETFAEHGATVILLGRTVKKLEHTYDAIMELDAPEPVILPVDLKGAKIDDYATIAAQIQQQFGRLDGILHNAAVLGALTPINLFDVRKWYDIMQTNLHAPFLLTQALLPLLKQSPDALVLFTYDAVGEQGKAYWGAYSVAKAGLRNFMEILADELAENTAIRVNAVQPPPTNTRLRKQAYPVNHFEDLPEPQAYMQQYLYLMGPDSKEVNAEVIEL